MEQLDHKRPVVMLISPDFGQGGAERSIAKLSFLLAEFCIVHFVVFNADRKQVYPVAGDIHFLDGPRKSLFGRVGDFYWRIRAAAKLKRKLKVDVTISFLEGADYVNILSRQRDRVVISIRGSKEADEEIKGWFGSIRKKTMMPRLYRHADHVVAVSDGIRDEVVRTLGLDKNKVVTITNYYDLREIIRLGHQPLPDNAKNLFDVPVIINAGRMHPQKNQKASILVMALLRNTFKLPCRLILVGDGELSRELMDVCVANKLSFSVLNHDQLDSNADVVFLGYQSNPWMFIAPSKVFLLTSSWEGFPNALAEAMCLNVPVVSANCPHGPSEILTGKPRTPETKDEVCWTSAGVLVPLLTSDEAIRQCAIVVRQLLAGEPLVPLDPNGGRERIGLFSESAAANAWRRIIDQV